MTTHDHEHHESPEPPEPMDLPEKAAVVAELRHQEAFPTCDDFEAKSASNPERIYCGNCGDLVLAWGDSDD